MFCCIAQGNGPHCQLMVMKRRTNIRSTKERFGKALLLLLISLQVHILVGIGVWWWQQSQKDETTPRERVVELEYVPQPKKPPVKPKARIPLPARARRHAMKKKRPRAPAKPKLAKKAPPRPRPRAIPRPRPKAKPRLVARRFRFRRKMVDQPTKDKQSAPKHFKFWAQANRNVKKQTRARKTNLTHNDTRPKNVLHGRKRRVRQAERRAPRPAPRTKPALPSPKSPKPPRPQPVIAKHQPRPTPRPKPRKPQPLMMTRIPRKTPRPAPNHLRRPTTAVVGSGPLDMRLYPRHPVRTAPERMRRAQQRPHRAVPIQVMPTKNAIQRLFAAQWRKEALRRIRSGPRRAPSTDPSEHRWKRIKAAIENYISEVTPGNTTALRTRAHPFARYITAMHRKIHPLWGDGFLVDWDMKPKQDPMNAWSRWAMVEIVLNRDGTLAKAGLVKSSGYMPFDAAALDVVFSAAPFGKPPAAILSGDKKVYLQWRFHRDQRQCGTFGVDAFILTHPKSSPTTDPGQTASGSGARWNPGRTISRLRRGPALEAARPRPGSGPTRQNGAAAWTARAWLAAASSRRLDALEAVTALPLRFAGRVVARTKQQLVKVYKSLLAEQSGRASGRVRIMTASQLRQALGYLPKGLSTPPGALYALANLDRNVIVLVLCRQDGRYRICDMAR